MRLKANLALFLVAVLWGSAFAAQRVAAQAGSVYFFNGARFLLAALVLFPFSRRVAVSSRQWLWMSAGGMILFIAGALFWAFHVILIGKFASSFEPVSFSAGQLFVGSLLNFVAGVLFERLVLLHPIALIGAVVYTAMISIGLGYTLQIWGQRHTPPTDAAIILSLESVFAVIGGWLILGERLAPLQVAGCTVILVGVILSQVKGWGKIDIEGR